MAVATLYLIIMGIFAFKNEIDNISINTLLGMMIILLSCGIISICSRLDDLKRK